MSTAQETTKRLADELQTLLASTRGTFTIGGSIPIAASTDGSSAESASPPVTIRWDSPSAAPGDSLSIKFPAPDQGRLSTLLKDCQPATFGRGSEAVLDETYRKASKLDSSAFATDLCPYELGIIDTVGKLLMPSKEITGGSMSIRAELYKLNVYSAPSGHFKAHVDTPRSEQQFGSLVVCLPLEHSGGGLALRHEGHEVVYDWGAASATTPVIQWSAFYSDVEHEVLEVTAGHRVTLTYNLYTRAPGNQKKDSTNKPDYGHLPLYKAIKETFSNPLFLPKGGQVGFYCQHAYPTTARISRGAWLFHSALKGVDLLLYDLLSDLGLEVYGEVVLLASALLDDYDYDTDVEENEENDAEEVGTIDVYTRGYGLVVTEVGGGEEEPDRILREFGQLEHVFWINKNKSENQQTGFVHATYGNEPGIRSQYTDAALLVTLKSADQRK